MNDNTAAFVTGVAATLTIELLVVLLVRSRLPRFVRNEARKAIVDEIPEPLMTPSLVLWDSLVGNAVEHAVAKALKL